ncbi:PASTA domain-containing protein [Variovorax paradoxus]|nr:PASTA domain-containing protein [Variovorax paradoxus]MBT2301723.1 PASTA domain-containing protein [Variovorax paradoxus]
MPDLFGMTCGAAQQRIAQAFHAQLLCATGAGSGRAPPGRIYQQSPEAQSPVRPGASVQYRAWTEPDSIVVPQVTGMRADLAIATISQARLRPRYDGARLDRWQWIESQDPSGGSKVTFQAPVQLRMVGRYRVPDLTGQTCADADRLVRDQGLRGLRCLEEAGPGTPPPGRIYSQVPTAGTVLSVPQQVEARHQPLQVIVPDVLGLPEVQAVEALRRQRLAAVMGGPGASRGRQVANQTPRGGTPVLPGTEVALTLRLTVPALLGLDCQRALAQAGEYGFADLRCEPQLAGPTQQLHRVFEQTPPAGTMLAAPRQLVALYALPVQVPDVGGSLLGDALAALGKVPLTGQPDASDGDRQVTTQRPGPGSEVAPRSAVMLTTQRYEKVPSVIGLSLPDARARLRDLGFGASPDHADRSSSRKVDAQKPSADERVAAGSAVGLTTHVEVEVPNVVGQMLPEAATTLANGGLNGNADRDDHRSDRQVRVQRPEAKTFVAEHSDVTLTTVRMVKVLPPMVGDSCKLAREKGQQAGVKVQCKVESAVPIVLGEPVVTAQPPLDAAVDEGTLIEVKAVPPWWSTPSLLALALSATGSLGWAGRKAIRPPRPPPAPPAPPSALILRVAPDLDPSLNVRFADESGWGGPREPRLNWRLAINEPLVCLRGLQDLSGATDDFR